MLIRALCQVIAGPTVEPHRSPSGHETKAVMLDLVQPHLAGGSVSALVASPPGDEAGREGTLQHSKGSKTFALSRNEA
jgi:hypothetical protein